MRSHVEKSLGSLSYFREVQVCFVLQLQLTWDKRPFQVNIFFHSLSNYNLHFLIQKLGEYKKFSINVIPRNSDKYLSFTLGSLKFKDSYQFLQCSLFTLVDNLVSKGEDNFEHLKHFIPDLNMQSLLMRKGIILYSFFSHLSILKHTQLPNKEAFTNDLDGSAIAPEDYAHYFSRPHFTYDAFLRYLGVKLDLLTDINQYFFLERGIWGGFLMVAKRYVKANHPKILGYDSSKPVVNILDLDVNNLYGKAMQDYLPYRGFRWMAGCELMEEQIMKIAPDADEECFVECTLDYPEALHDLNADYPLVPIKTKITYDMLSPYAQFLCDHHKLKYMLKTEKLLTTFQRSFYVLHYQNFQLYVRLGKKVMAIHSALAFHQALYKKSYVNMNTEKRAKTTNKVDADFTSCLWKVCLVKSWKAHKSEALSHQEWIGETGGLLFLQVVQNYQQKFGRGQNEEFLGENE